MDIRKSFKEVLEKTSVVKVPKHRISTFGNTRIQYFFVSELPALKDRSRLREGLVIAESPKILTPEMMKNRFEGFGDESEEFGKWLSDKYGASLRGLQYRFRNESVGSKVEYLPLKDLSENLSKSLERGPEQSALIQGPDTTWQISLMKFIVDECMRSFVGNLRELDEHGYFESPGESQAARRKEVEGLFARAESDPSSVPLLGDRLKRYGLFKEYEDRFFRLVQR